MGNAGNAGSANGGSSNGGSSNGGSGQGGSASPGNGGAANGGSGGSGMGGTMMAEAGSGGDTGGTGGSDGEPDAGPQDPPDEETVGFSEIYPILTARCGNCHGNPNGGPPAFAQANQTNAYAVTQANNQFIAGRIIARAVTARTMPPGCNGGAFGTATCIAADQADDLEAWLDDGALP